MKKRHHFIPRFYLRRFATIEPREEIWTYDMHMETARSSTVDSTAFEKHLYGATLDDGSRIDDLEDFISKIENKAATLFDQLLRGAPVIAQDRADLASFFALMFVRTDAFRRQYAQMSVNNTQVKMQATAAHDGAFANFVARFEADRGPLCDEDKRMMRDAMCKPGQFSVSVAKEWTLRALRFHDRLAPLIYDMQWTIMRAKPSLYFITSDNPLVKALPDRFRHPWWGEGFANKHIEITLPLSSDRCLLAHWHKGTPTAFDLCRQDVKATNRIRAVSAERFLFCHKHDAGIVNLAAKYRSIRQSIQIGFDADEYSEVELRRTSGSV